MQSLETDCQPTAGTVVTLFSLNAGILGGQVCSILQCTAANNRNFIRTKFAAFIYSDNCPGDLVDKAPWLVATFT